MTVTVRAAAIAEDREAGASELLARLLPILADAIAIGPDQTLAVARRVCRGQPAMAALWHACAAAVADAAQPGTFAQARAEMERAPRALVRAASAALIDLLAGEKAPLLLTVSYSGSVAQVLAGRQFRGVRVLCGESRPGLEGTRLAADLARAGLDAAVVIDAALTSSLRDASAVVMGADAVGAERWINKVGSFGLAAAASFTGTPVYVIAGREKLVPAALEAHLGTPPPLFESIPSELATLILTDVGPLSPDDLLQAVNRHEDRICLLISQL